MNQSLEEYVKTFFFSTTLHQLQETLDVAYQVRLKNFGSSIHFYTPSFTPYKTRYYCPPPSSFPTISLTGNACALHCKHCGGRVLNTMYSAETPEKLFDVCKQIKQAGALGCLISGGCLPDGSVPLQNFGNVLKKIKQDLDLVIHVHTGLISRDVARQLKEAEIDAALIDIIGSTKTIQEIYHLDSTVQVYEDSLKALTEFNLPFIPHIIAGLHFGKLRGELNALKIVSKYNPVALVIIAFMPLHGTEMEHISPPTPLSITKVVVAARLMFPKTLITLGCMRPKGDQRETTDVLAIKAGINGIAFPTDQAIKFARKRHLKVNFSPFCCSQIYTA